MKNSWEIVQEGRYFTNKNLKTYIVKNKEKFKDLEFIGQAINFKKTNVSENLLLQKKKILDRIVKISNLAETTKLPEIIDFINYRDFSTKYNNKKMKDNLLIMEYLQGIDLKKACKTSFFAAKNKNFININRLFRKILKNIVEFQIDLYKKNLFHIGVFPEHVIIQKDDIVKFKGLRYIVHHKDGIINDPTIFNDLYGNIENIRYSSPSFRKYIRGEYPKAYVLDIMSHQLGVLIFDILTYGQYFSERDYFYPQTNVLERIQLPIKKQEVKVKTLIYDLTNPDIKKRIYRPEEILDRFDDILTA
jgi:hypothetical protein